MIKKTIGVFGILLLLGIPLSAENRSVKSSGCSGNAPGSANPAAVYCRDLGYEYRIVDDPEGQYGLCVFPDGSECSAGDFWKVNADKNTLTVPDAVWRL